MKYLHKILAMLLALTVVLSLSCAAFAAEADFSKHSITIRNEVKVTNLKMKDQGAGFKAYRVFDLKYKGEPGEPDTSKPAYSYTLNPAFKGFQFNTGDTALDNETYPNAAGVITDPKVMIDYLDKKRNDAAAVQMFAKAVQAFVDGKSGALDHEAYPRAGHKAVYTPADSGSIYVESLMIPVDQAGYYVILNAMGTPTDGGTAEVVAAIAMDSTAKDAVVNLKADVPQLVKGVLDPNAGALFDSLSVQVGEMVSFTLASDMPDINAYSADNPYKLTFHDGWNSQALKFGSKTHPAVINIKFKGKSNTYNYQIGKGNIPAGFTLEPSFEAIDDHFDLTMDLNALRDNLLQGNPRYSDCFEKGAGISVTYSLIVQDGIVNKNFEKNTANLTFSRDPYTTATGKTPDQHVKLYTFGLDIDKSDGKEKLSGAEFVLYFASPLRPTPGPASIGDELSDGPIPGGPPVPIREYYCWKKGADPELSWIRGEDSSVPEGATVLTTRVENGKCFLVNQDGVKDSFKSLRPGLYGLREIKAPDGYNLLTEDIMIRISTDASPGEGHNAGGTQVYGASFEHVMVDVTYRNNQGGDSKLPHHQDIPFPGTGDNIHVTVPVLNTTGVRLPSTGGVGTTIFYILGGVLMVGALVVLITRKKVSDKD